MSARLIVPFITAVACAAAHATPGQEPAAAEPSSQDLLRAKRDAIWNEGRAQVNRIRYDEALETAETVIALSERLDQGQGLETAEALDWKVWILLHRQDYQDAVPVADQIVEIRERLKDKPWQVADARVQQRYVRRLAELPQGEVDRIVETALDLDRVTRLANAGRVEEAVRLGEDALARRKRLLGFVDHMYAEWIAVIAIHCRSLPGYEDRAARYFEQARQAIRELYGTQHRRYAALLSASALGYFDRDEFERAEELLTEALEIFTAVLGPGHVTTTRTVEQLATAQRSRAWEARDAGDLEAAEGHFRRQGRTWSRRHGPQHWRVREADTWAADCRFLRTGSDTDLGRLGEAMDAARRAKKLADDGRPREAIPLIRESYETIAAVAGEHHRAALNVLWGLAVTHDQARQFREAEDLYFRATRANAKTLGAEHQDTKERAETLYYWLREWAEERVKRGEFTEAIRLMGKAAEADLLRYPTQPWRARSHRATADHFRRLAELDQPRRDRLAEADRLMDECETLNERQKFREALHLAEEVLAVRLEVLGPEDDETVEALHTLGNLQGQLGHHALSVKTLERCLAGREKLLGKEHSRYAFTLRELAATFARAGDYQRAIELNLETADILRETLGPDHRQYIDILIHLITLYSYIGRLDHAYTLIKEVEEWSVGHPDVPAVSHSLGGFYAKLDHPETALVLYERAGAGWEEEKDWVNYAINRDNVSNVYIRLGELDKAEPIALEAVELFRKHLGDRHPTTATGFTNLGELYRRKGDFAEGLRYQIMAIRASKENLGLAADIGIEATQMAAFGRFRVDIDLYLTLAERAGVPPEETWAEVLAWKGAVVARQSFLRKAAKDPKLAPLVGELRSASAGLADTLRQRPDPDGRHEERVKGLERRREELGRQLADAVAGLGLTSPDDPDPAAVRSALPDAAALVDYFVVSSPATGRPSRVFAHLIRKGEPTLRLDLGEAEPIIVAVEAWRAILIRSGQSAEAGAALRRLVWEPLEEHLGGADLVLVSPDGSLNLVPFGALPGRRPGRYLIEDYPVIVVPTPRSLAGGDRPERNPPSLLAVGNPEFGPRDLGVRPLSPLPGTLGEIDVAQSRFTELYADAPARALTGGSATKANFLDALTGRRYLHLATHGFAGDAPGEPAQAQIRAMSSAGLAFAGYNRDPAGAVLTALEAAELNLEGVELVVLSACQTGLGRVASGDGVLGLQRAFQLAGADAVVVSLWPVDDRATERLMGAFYQNLWARKMSKGRALREAQLAMIRGQIKGAEVAVAGVAGGGSLALARARGVVRPGGSADYTLPYYWAGFVLAGDWR